MRRLCLSIGVANAKALGYLPGAANAARDMGHWARTAGYDRVSVLTDEARTGSWRWDLASNQTVATNAKGAVTADAIKDELDALLREDPDETEIFLLHFAGHGFRRNDGRALWVTTDWKTSKRVVAVELLKFRLEEYAIRNLTIVSDACLTFPDSTELDRLTDDGVLGAGITGQADLVLDRFNAAKDGDSAFMVKAANPEEARCILSGVLIDTLWGHEKAAFDRHNPGQITSGSLCEFLPGRTGAVGRNYEVVSEAEVFQGQPREHVIYLDTNAAPPLAPPPPGSWPAPAAPPPDEPSASIGFTTASDRSENRVRAAAAAMRAEEVRSGLLRSTEYRRPFRSNLILEGGDVRRVWSRLRPEKRSEGRWSFVVRRGAAEQVILDYGDGLFVPVVVYGGLNTIVMRDGNGLAGWMCDEDIAIEDSRKAADIVGKMAAGSIDPAEIPVLAAAIRGLKHANPMLGAIAAYLYDYIGDRDNIRRMAWYYQHHGQPIPYDIAFMGVVNSWREMDCLFVHIPSVEARPQQGMPDYACVATEEVKRWPVAGVCPWLRQGWDFVDRPEAPERAMISGLQNSRQHVESTAYTAIDAKLAQRLIGQWGLGGGEGFGEGRWA